MAFRGDSDQHTGHCRESGAHPHGLGAAHDAARDPRAAGRSQVASGAQAPAPGLHLIGWCKTPVLSLAASPGCKNGAVENPAPGGAPQDDRGLVPARRL